MSDLMPWQEYHDCPICGAHWICEDPECLQPIEWECEDCDGARRQSRPDDVT